MGPGEFVCSGDKLEGILCNTVDRNGLAVLEANFDRLAYIRCVLWKDAHSRLDPACRCRQSFELTRLVGETKDIGVGGVGFLQCRLHREGMSLAIGDHLAASAEGLEERVISPRGVGLNSWVEHLGGEFEANLIIAPTRGAMAQNVYPSRLHFRNHTSNYDVATDASGVPVAALVASASLNQLQACLRHILPQIANDHFTGTAGQHALANVLDIVFVWLAQICCIADDIHVVLGKPMRDCAAIEPTRYCHEDGLALQIMQLH